jgi:FixJ family two-component response regulator
LVFSALAAAPPNDKVLLINEALEQLRTEDPEKARIVVMKFFGGLTNQEVAENLDVTERTVDVNGLTRRPGFTRRFKLKFEFRRSNARTRGSTAFANSFQ